MDNDLTLTTARRYVKELAEARPGYVYDEPNTVGSATCVYVNTKDQPSCILGNLFISKQGESTAQVKLFDGYSSGEGVVNGEDAALTLGWDEEAAQYLGFIQRKQDAGTSWDQAYREGEDYFARGYHFEYGEPVPNEDNV